MNRLEKLKYKLAQERRCILTEVREILPIDDIVVDEFNNGWNACSAEYEKIIAELEGALDSIIEIDLITHKMHPEYEGQFSEYADRAKEALQKLSKFRGGE